MKKRRRLSLPLFGEAKEIPWHRLAGKGWEAQMMRAIKIDPFSKTITEIDVTSSDELVTIIGSDRLVLTPLDRGINLLSGENDETKPSFGFYGLPDLVVYGVAAIVGGTMKLMRPLHEGLRSFELTVEWGEIA